MLRTLPLIALVAAAALPAAAAEPGPVCKAHLLTVEADGKVTHGSKDRVREAVMAGQPLRIGWSLDWNKDGKGDVIHWADAMFLTVFEDDVFAQIEQIHRQHPKPGASDVELAADALYWSSSIGTNGVWRGRFQSQAPVAWPVTSWWCIDPRALPRR
ncbi:MAG TPA: hypothetical protein VEY50_00970 [Lysobacter sp.]|nr:hypothetical protein [Lysobacter sp.]